MMNYAESPPYLKPPASRPMDMYAVKNSLANQAGMIADALVNLGQTANDHALRLDELRKDHEDLRALLLWITEAHPDVVKQYFAVKDIERASK